MVLNRPTSSRQFSAFGYTLRSSELFSPWLEENNQPSTDIFISQISRPLFSFSSKNHIFSNPRLLSGRSILQIYRSGDLWGMRLAKIGDFFFRSQEISFIPYDPNYFPSLQSAMLSNVLAFWMELHGLCTLHGASLKWQNRTFALLADSTSGKSTLTASLLLNSASLLSDDITAVESNTTGFHLRPGYASMRLGLDQVEHFLGKQANLARIIPKLDKAIIPIGSKGWAKFEQNNQTPACFYILERMPPGKPADIEIQPLKPVEAVIALVRYSFVRHAPLFTGTSAERLEFITRLASLVPVKRLVYPSGYENLTAVCAVIQHDLITTDSLQ